MKLLRALFAFLAIASNAAFGAITYGNNFTMLGPDGGVAGGTNDAIFTWDGTLNTDPSTAISNASLYSSYPFGVLPWTVYELKIYGPGSYTISTGDTPGTVGCPMMLPVCSSGSDYSVTVLPGQLMGHMKGSWGDVEGIDVINVWDRDAVFGPSSLSQASSEQHTVSVAPSGEFACVAPEATRNNNIARAPRPRWLARVLSLLFRAPPRKDYSLTRRLPCERPSLCDGTAGCAGA